MNEKCYAIWIMSTLMTLLLLLILGSVGSPSTQAQVADSTATPRASLTLQDSIDSRPEADLGTWFIGGVQVIVDEQTVLVDENGALRAGACVSLTYVSADGGNVALSIISEPLSVCGIEGTPPPAGTVWQGRILLQGRDIYSGTAVFLSDSACDSAAFADVPDATTDETGLFQVVSEETYRCLRLDRPSYLAIERTLRTADVGQLTLLAGDVNGDGIINILDIAAISSKFDTADPLADLNADGLVDIFDIVLAARNYQR